ncbi:MAG: anti-sigma factor [bacterium]
MINGMTHEEAREALGALALDALDASERAAVLAHVADCSSCRDELMAMRETAAKLAYVVSPVPMADEQRDRVRARLLARASLERSAPPVQTPTTPMFAQVTPASPVRILEPSHVPRNTPHRSTPSVPPLVLRPTVVPHDAAIIAMHRMEARSRWMAAAAVVVAVGSVWALMNTREERDDMKVQLQLATVEARADGKVMDSLRAGLTARDRMIANLTGPEVAVVTLAANSPRSPSARMFWDQSVGAWTFVAHNLPQPRNGRTYQLWLVTTGGKVSAGLFSPNGSGDAVVKATYPLARDALAAVAVTDEPTEGSPQPTTTPVLVGTTRAR